MKHIALILIGLLAVSTSCIAENTVEPIVFRTLLIIKPSTNVTTGEKTIQSTMTPEDIAAVTRVYMEYAPKIVQTLTKGRVQWKPKVIVSMFPLTSLSYIKSSKSYWAGPKDVVKDIDEYVTPGTYDTFCIYYKPLLNDGTRPLPVNSDWGLSPRATTNHAGMSSVHWKNPKTLTYETASTEAFVHEWLHNLEYFYQAKGVKLPKGGLQGAETNGYTSIKGTWKKWYADFLNGKVKDADGTYSGLGETAWAKGTLRDAALRLTPKYMRQKIKAGATNRLAGLPQKGQWRSESQTPVKYTTPKVVRFASSYSITMNNIKANDHRLFRSMKLKPNTPYLFAANIQTVNVKVAEAGGMIGAAIEAGKQRSRSVAGTQSGQYVATEFVTDDEGKADVILRIGGQGSIAKGSATFRDLRLIEIPK
jgi:hypothetical protein